MSRRSSTVSQSAIGNKLDTLLEKFGELIARNTELKRQNEEFKKEQKEAPLCKREKQDAAIAWLALRSWRLTGGHGRGARLLGPTSPTGKRVSPDRLISTTFTLSSLSLSLSLSSLSLSFSRSFSLSLSFFLSFSLSLSPMLS